MRKVYVHYGILVNDNTPLDEVEKIVAEELEYGFDYFSLKVLEQNEEARLEDLIERGAASIVSQVTTG